jgi:hypothetical protein
MKSLTELQDYARLLGAQLQVSDNSTGIIIQMPAQRRQIQSGQAGNGFSSTSCVATRQQNIDEAYDWMKKWEELWTLKNDISKKELKTYIQARLHEDKQAIRTLLLIFSKQTASEQQTEQTTIHNNVGFTGVDAEILSSFAKQYQTRNFLSPKQMVILKKMIKKYWQQVIDESIVKGNELALLRMVKAARPVVQSAQLTMRLA